LRELREERRSYFGHLTYHLAVALFFTGCRFHEWARLTFDRLVHEPGGVIIAARLQLKGGSFRDLPLTKELSDSLEEWFAFLVSVKGVRLRGGEWTSRDLRSSFLAVTALPLGATEGKLRYDPISVGNRSDDVGCSAVVTAQ
jgi:integrase